MNWLVHVKGGQLSRLTQQYGVIDSLRKMSSTEHSVYREFNRLRVGIPEQEPPVDEADALGVRYAKSVEDHLKQQPAEPSGLPRDTEY